MATPEEVSNPPIKDPKDMALFKNNSVNTTLDAQFGISPIKHVIVEPKILSFRKTFSKYSIPP